MPVVVIMYFVYSFFPYGVTQPTSRRSFSLIYGPYAGTPDDKNNTDALAIEKALGVSVLTHSSKKPSGIEDICRRFEGCVNKKENFEKENFICMPVSRVCAFRNYSTSVLTCAVTYKLLA